MKRVMVLWGLGSILLAGSTASAETQMPRSLTALTPGAATITWHDNLQSGWQESRRRNVPMLIFITSENCSYCDAMKRDTWCDASIRQRVANGFVAIRLTPRNNRATLSRIDVKMYPMTLVGAPRGKVIAHRLGYQPPTALHQLLSDAKNRRTQ